MITEILFLISVPIVVIAIIVRAIIILPRLRMERRAHEILAKHPDAEQTSVYLPLYSPLPWDKQREMDAKIAEMQQQGWIFLRASSANFFRTIRSWGGGLTLHFIRTTMLPN